MTEARRKLDFCKKYKRWGDEIRWQARLDELVELADEFLGMDDQAEPAGNIQLSSREATQPENGNDE